MIHGAVAYVSLLAYILVEWVQIAYCLFRFNLFVVFLLVQQLNNRVLALYNYKPLDVNELHLTKVGSIMTIEVSAFMLLLSWP